MDTTRTIVIAVAALFLAGAAGCEDPTDPNVPEPTVGEATVGQPATGGQAAGPASGSESAIGAEGGAETTDDEDELAPLERALSAPADAITSEGRWEQLAERGLDEHVPATAVFYAEAGVDRPALRVAVEPTGRVRWARGQGAYYKGLDERGEAALGEEARAGLAEPLDGIWTTKVDFPPTEARQTQVLIVRDGAKVRVFESSTLPESLQPIAAVMRKLVPPAK